MNGSMVFARWRLCAPPSNTCFLEPTWVQNPNGISIGTAVFAQQMAQSCYTLQPAEPFPLKLSFPMEDLDPHLIHGFFSPPESSAQMVHRSVQLFLQSSWQCVPTFYNGQPLLSIAPCHEGIWAPHLMHDSLGPCEPITQTASRSVQPFLQGSLLQSIQGSLPAEHLRSPGLFSCPTVWSSLPDFIRDLIISADCVCLKPNSITLSGLKLVADRFEAKFHYAIWFEAGCRQVQSWSRTC